MTLVTLVFSDRRAVFGKYIYILVVFRINLDATLFSLLASRVFRCPSGLSYLQLTMVKGPTCPIPPSWFEGKTAIFKGKINLRIFVKDFKEKKLRVKSKVKGWGASWGCVCNRAQWLIYSWKQLGAILLSNNPHQLIILNIYITSLVHMVHGIYISRPMTTHLKDWTSS